MPVTPPVLNLTGLEGQMVLQKYNPKEFLHQTVVAAASAAAACLLICFSDNSINPQAQKLHQPGASAAPKPNQSELGGGGVGGVGWSLTEVHSLTPHSRRSSTPSQLLKVTEVSMSSGSSSASLTWSSTKSRCTCTSVHVSVSSTAASTAGSLKQEVPGTEGGVRTR